MALKIFFSYAHEDELLVNAIKKQLKSLERQGLIEMWYDREIHAGMAWEHEIDKHLNIAQIILLIISPDFMYSEYAYSVEAKQAIERHKRGDARVIPVILRPIYWQGEFGMLQALPKDALPVTNWDTIDNACFNVAEGIRKVVQEMSEKKPPVILKDDPNKVVVVAARNALPEYLKHSVYICQPNRTFQDCVRFAFYTNNKIDRRVPKILGKVEAISKDEIETREDLNDIDRERLRVLLRNLEPARRADWSQQLKIIFLSSPESSDTLILPYDIVNNVTTSNGRTVAFTQGQRYVSLARLEKQPKTTSELVQDTHHPDPSPVSEATNTEKRGNAKSDKLSPSNISSEYKHIGKTHRCEIHFTLSKEHSLSYEFQWHGFQGDRFTLSVDGSQIIDTKWQFLGIPHLRKSFEVENIGGLFSYTRTDNRFSVTITVGNVVVFNREDGWNS